MSPKSIRGEFMARKGRIQSKTGIYHVLLRGVNLLFKEHSDFEEFTDTLKKYSTSGEIKIYAYTLLKNRIHLVIDGGEDIGKALKPICTSYARYFNRTHAESGKLFYDRFKSEPVDSVSELKGVVAFVNAISKKCGEDYPYSSLSLKGQELCTKDKLTAAERTSTKITDIYMEDFDCLSVKEIGGYIFDLCGIMPKDFKNLSKAELDSAVDILTKKRWIARTKLFEILGIKKAPQSKKNTQKSVASQEKNTPKPKAKPQPKPEPKSEQKKELSFWLL